MNKREIPMSESSQDLSTKTQENSVAEDKNADVKNNASPGRILSAAREELNFTLEQVAQELHLRPSVVLAMEEEKYDDFSSDVFLKGYFRSYCRLVNLHEERMVDLLESQLKGLQKDIDDAAHLIKKEKQSQKQKKAFVGLVLVALVIGVLSFIVSLFYANEEPPELVNPIVGESNVQTQQEPKLVTLPTTEPQVADSALRDVEKDTKSEIVRADVTNNLNTKQELGSTVEQTQDRSDTAETKIEEVSESEQMNQLTQQEQPNESSEVLSELKEQPKVVETNNLALESVSFEAIFSGDCWFKMVDGNDKTVFAALKREGDRIIYKGLPPFKLVLGDATKAALTFNGEAVNLQSHTANNGRAQLTLNRG